MKKIIFLICGFIFVLAEIGWAVSDGSWGTSMSTISFTPSKNVSIYWDVDQDNNTYALGSKHTKGNRVFATTSATNQIYYKESDDYVNKSGSAAISADNMPDAGQTTLSGWSAI